MPADKERDELSPCRNREREPPQPHHCCSLRCAGFSPHFDISGRSLYRSSAVLTPLSLTERGRLLSENAVDLIRQYPRTACKYRAFAGSGSIGAQPSTKRELLAEYITLRAVTLRLVVRVRVC